MSLLQCWSGEAYMAESVAYSIPKEFGYKHLHDLPIRIHPVHVIWFTLGFDTVVLLDISGW